MEPAVHRSAFTLPGLLCVVLGAVLLLGLVAPSMVKGRRASDAVRCAANLRQLGAAMHGYSDDNNDVFPAHQTINSDRIMIGWWGTDILNYVEDRTNAFRCAVLRGRRVDRGTRWQWKFDAHQGGYGYNAYFLGSKPYEGLSLTVGGIVFSTTPTFKRAWVVKPAENILVGERTPSGSPPDGGSILWWPTACMDPQRSVTRLYEGVETERHSKRGAVVFNDGHVELRRDTEINPPYDPSSGNARALTNANLWDPLRRGR